MTSELELEVQQELSETEPVDQAEFVKSLEESGHDENRVLGTLRNLMEQDKVSYTLDYNLQTENDA